MRIPRRLIGCLLAHAGLIGRPPRRAPRALPGSKPLYPLFWTLQGPRRTQEAPRESPGTIRTHTGPYVSIRIHTDTSQVIRRPSDHEPSRERLPPSAFSSKPSKPGGFTPPLPPRAPPHSLLKRTVGLLNFDPFSGHLLGHLFDHLQAPSAPKWHPFGDQFWDF